MSGEYDELDAQSFNSNYRILKETADWLSDQEEPDIDQLVPRVETAMEAYRVCEHRLDTVKQTLEQCLAEDDREQMGSDSRNANGRRSRRPPAASSSDGEEDIDF